MRTKIYVSSSTRSPASKANSGSTHPNMCKKAVLHSINIHLTSLTTQNRPTKEEHVRPLPQNWQSATRGRPSERSKKEASKAKKSAGQPQEREIWSRNSEGGVERDSCDVYSITCYSRTWCQPICIIIKQLAQNYGLPWLWEWSTSATRIWMRCFSLSVTFTQNWRQILWIRK